MTAPAWTPAKLAPFTPKHTREKSKAATIADLRNRVVENVDRLTADTRLTDAGKRDQFTSDAGVILLTELQRHERDVREARAKVTADRAALRAQRQPVKADATTRADLEALYRMARESEAGRRHLLAILDDRTPSPDVERLQLGALSVSSLIAGPDLHPVVAQYQTLLTARYGLNDDGKAGEALNETEAAIEEELDAIRETRLAILTASDRARLNAIGLAPKPVQEWSRDEVREFVRTHGTDEYARVLFEETTSNASTHTDRLQGVEFIAVPERTDTPADASATPA